MSLTVDFHAHVLPEMDHGCSNVRQSLEQLKLAKNAGVECIFATSHFYPQSESVKAFIKRRDKACQMLVDSGVQVWNKDESLSLLNFGCIASTYPIVVPAAEVLICPGMDRMSDLSELCVAGTKLLMLEMPFTEWNESIIETMDRLHEKDCLYIMQVHIERYSKEQRKIILQRRYDVQLNSSYICSFKKKKIAKTFTKCGLVKALGSDMHGTSIGYRYWSKASNKLKRWGIDDETVIHSFSRRAFRRINDVAPFDGKI